MYNSQYYTCEQIDQRLLQNYLDDYNTQNNTSLSKAEFLTQLSTLLGKSATIDNIVAQIGYYICDTAAATAAKVLTAANYELLNGGSLKVKFTYKNTASSVTLNINSKGAKTLYYGSNPVSATNTWEANEVVEIFYDGTNYYANNVNGGSGSGVYDVSVEHPTAGPNGDGKFTLDYILNSSNVDNLIPVNKRRPGMIIQFVSTSDNKYVQYRLMADDWSTTVSDWQGVDDVPVAGSENIVMSGGVYEKLLPLGIETYSRNIEIAAAYNNYDLNPKIPQGTIVNSLGGYTGDFIYKSASSSSFITKRTTPFTLTEDAEVIRGSVAGTMQLSLEYPSSFYTKSETYTKEEVQEEICSALSVERFGDVGAYADLTVSWPANTVIMSVDASSTGNLVVYFASENVYVPVCDFPCKIGFATTKIRYTSATDVLDIHIGTNSDTKVLELENKVDGTNVDISLSGVLAYNNMCPPLPLSSGTIIKSLNGYSGTLYYGATPSGTTSQHFTKDDCPYTLVADMLFVKGSVSEDVILSVSGEEGIEEDVDNLKTSLYGTSGYTRSINVEAAYSNIVLDTPIPKGTVIESLSGYSGLFIYKKSTDSNFVTVTSYPHKLTTDAEVVRGSIVGTITLNIKGIEKEYATMSDLEDALNGTDKSYADTADNFLKQETDKQITKIVYFGDSIFFSGFGNDDGNYAFGTLGYEHFAKKTLDYLNYNKPTIKTVSDGFSLSGSPSLKSAWAPYNSVYSGKYAILDSDAKKAVISSITGATTISFVFEGGIQDNDTYNTGTAVIEVSTNGGTTWQSPTMAGLVGEQTKYGYGNTQVYATAKDEFDTSFSYPSSATSPLSTNIGTCPIREVIYQLSASSTYSFRISKKSSDARPVHLNGCYYFSGKTIIPVCMSVPGFSWSNLNSVVYNLLYLIGADYVITESPYWHDGASFYNIKNAIKSFIDEVHKYGISLCLTSGTPAGVLTKDGTISLGDTEPSYYKGENLGYEICHRRCLQLLSAPSYSDYPARGSVYSFEVNGTTYTGYQQLAVPGEDNYNSWAYKSKIMLVFTELPKLELLENATYPITLTKVSGTGISTLTASNVAYTLPTPYEHRDLVKSVCKENNILFVDILNAYQRIAASVGETIESEPYEMNSGSPLYYDGATVMNYMSNFFMATDGHHLVHASVEMLFSLLQNDILRKSVFKSND